MSCELIFTPEAEADITQAVKWYQNQCDGLGRAFLRCLDPVFERIKHTPKIHAIAYRNVRLTFVRKFPYVVCYVHSRDRVTVVAVFHASRAPEDWQQRVD